MAKITWTDLDRAMMVTLILAAASSVVMMWINPSAAVSTLLVAVHGYIALCWTRHLRQRLRLGQLRPPDRHGIDRSEDVDRGHRP